MISYPKELDCIFDKLLKMGVKPVLVGGFIRDSLLCKESKDIDIELYGRLSFEGLQSLLQEFGRVNIVGKSFGVCKLKFKGYDLDFSFARRDNKIGLGHRGFSVELDSHLDFKTAASRRDFTINAIGYDVADKKLLDPFKGADDLKNATLRAVDLESFAEDPLRVLRAAQFCARFNLSIEPSLFRTCQDMVLNNMLAQLPKERVFEEIKKLLLKSKKPSIGFELLREFGTGIYTQGVIVTDEIAKRLTPNKGTNLVLMLAGLSYKMTQSEIEDFILQFTNEKEIIKRVCALVLAYNKTISANKTEIDDYFLYKLSLDVQIDEFAIVGYSICITNNNSKVNQMIKIIEKRAKELGVFREKLQPLLYGKDLISFGLQPSANFKKILEDAYEAQMHSSFKNHHEAIFWLKEYLKL